MDVHAVNELIEAQHGVISHEQAMAHGASRHQIQHLERRGIWERLHLGVFRIRGARSSYAQQLVAGCLAIGPEATASHRAAAAVHGLLSYREPRIEVTTNRLRSPEVAGVVVHRLTDLHERWVQVIDGVRVTTAARTLVDLGAVASSRTVEAALDRAAGRRLVTYRDVRDAMAAVARKGRRGVGTIRGLLEARIGEVLPAGVLAARMTTLIRNGGLPAATPEFVVTDQHGGFVAVVDFAFVDRRIAIEVDGYEFHSTPKAVDYGNARDRLLLAAGWTVLHFSWNEVEHHPDRVSSAILGTLKLT